MDLLKMKPEKHPRTASRLVAGEAVVVLPEEGRVKVLNEVGSRIWELADGTHSVDEIVEAICTEYKVSREQAQEEVVAFVTDMVEGELLAAGEAV